MEWRNLMTTLRMRIFLVFGLLFAAVVTADLVIERTGVSFLSFEGRNREKQREIFRALNLTADLKKERLLYWIEEREADSKMIAESPVLLSLLGGVEEQFHRNAGAGLTGEPLWERIRASDSYREIRGHIEVMMATYRAYLRIDVIDLHSGVIMISTNETDLGRFIYDEDVNLAGLSSLQGSFVDIWRHPGTDELDMHIARSIPLPGQKERGLVLILHVNTRHFLEPLLHTGDGLGETGEALLVNRDARILTPLKFPLPDGTRARALEYRVAAEPAQRAAAGEEGIIAAEDYRGVPVLAAYRHIRMSPGTGWGLVVKRDKAEIFRGYRRENLLSLMLLALGVLVFAGCSYLLAGSLSGPIQQVSSTARRIQEGDLSARVKVQGTEEVKALAEAFNAMVGQLNRYTDQLKEKNEELEAFLYTAAHDLKNPLIGAQGFLNLLSRTLPADLESRQRHLLERTIATLQQSERVLNDLLGYSRLRATPPEAGRVPVGRIIDRVKEEQWEKIKGSRAVIRVQEPLPEVQINESSAYQIFSNLISNSLKFAREGVPPFIEIGMIPDPEEWVPEDHALFFVSDNGVGIDPMWHEKVFGLFVRVDDTVEEGTGTGLAIVRRIVRQVNGKIWLKSTPGSGATFYFTLPTVS